MSNPNIEQLTAAQKANAEVMMALMRTAFNGVERLTALNMAASREFFNNTVANAQQLLSAKDANTVAKLNSELAQPNVNKLMSYSRSVYDLVSEMQKEVTGVMEAQYSTFTKNAESAVEKAKASAPVGGDVFAATMQSMLGASTKAFDQMTSMAKQLSDIAEANLQAASNVRCPGQEERHRCCRQEGRCQVIRRSPAQESPLRSGLLLFAVAKKLRPPDPGDTPLLDLDGEFPPSPCRPAPERPRRPVPDACAPCRPVTAARTGAASGRRRRCAPSGRAARFRRPSGRSSRKAFSISVGDRLEFALVKGIERPLDHRVRHLRKTRHEVVLIGHEAGDAVEGVGNHLHPLREGDQQLAPIGDLLAGKADLQILERLRRAVPARRRAPRRPPAGYGRPAYCRCRRRKRPHRQPPSCA